MKKIRSHPKIFRQRERLRSCLSAFSDKNVLDVALLRLRAFLSCGLAGQFARLFSFKTKHFGMASVLSAVALVFFIVPSQASDLPVKDIVRKRDDLMRGKSSYGRYEMIVKSRRWERMVRFRAWSEGKDNSFIVITYPKKDKGTTFLRIKTDMWQYVPKIEKTIKIPPSMMLQSWMGSDFTNDDLVKESSIVHDYTHTLLREDRDAFVIESLPRPEAVVVWGKVIQWIDKETFVPIKDEFYDEDQILVRRFMYDDVKKLPDRYYPMRWTIEPLTQEKQGHKTTIIISEIELNIDVAEDVFSMRALKDYSR